MSQFFPLKVIEVLQNTPSSVTVTFEILEEYTEQFKFVAGQYITIKKEINGQEIRRAYSVCTAPSENKLSVGIKAIKDGLFSVYANKELKVGDTLEIMPPEGRFVLENTNKYKNIALIAAGSGITPLLSIAKTTLAQNEENIVILVYGNKSISETMFYKDLEVLKQKYTHRFFIIYSFTSVKEDEALFGRIDKGAINFAFKNKFKELEFKQYFICGPEAMIKIAEATLLENGADASQIKFELFTSSSDENADKDTSLVKGKTEIKVILDGEETVFIGDSSKNLLDLVLAKDLDAPYSCQGGVCSSCVARVVDGKAKMVKNQILTDGEIEGGLILTCQAHVESPQITIDYDDA